jgi:hypothetical protein
MANMTGVTQGAFSSAPSAFKNLDPAKYIALGDFIDQVNKPDNRDKIVKAFGMQNITGFLQMVGASKEAGTNDEVTYWEEERLHQMQTITTGVGGVAAGLTQVLTFGTGVSKFIRLNDVVLMNGTHRAIVTAINVNGLTFTVANLKNSNLPAIVEGVAKLPIIGNLFAQGSDQQAEYLESNVVKRTNPYMIIKDIFKVTGSQATNIGWVDVGNGDYRWYIKGETDTRARYIDKREMMMLLGEVSNHSAVTGIGVSGSEGYFSAIENRGLVTNGYITDLADLDAIVKEFDKQGAGSEYAMYIDRTQDLLIDDLVAKGNSGSLTAGVAEQYGAFNNSKETAVNLGFRSFGRGGYTFHKHDWKLLNDPTLLADANFAGVAIPLSTVVDPKTGDRNPSLEINYKGSNGYSREMEHWVTGSILGAKNDTKDQAQFNYRSEINLVTRGANRHLLIKKA